MKLPIVNSMGQRIVIKIDILQVDETKVCVNFTKIEGECLAFYKEFAAMREYFSPLFNAEYA